MKRSNKHHSYYLFPSEHRFSIINFNSGNKQNKYRVLIYSHWVNSPIALFSDEIVNYIRSFTLWDCYNAQRIFKLVDK